MVWQRAAKNPFCARGAVVPSALIAVLEVLALAFPGPETYPIAAGRLSLRGGGWRTGCCARIVCEAGPNRVRRVQGDR